MHNLELPTWAGAATVYDRLMRANEAICASAYRIQRAKDKRKGFRFAVPEEAETIVATLNRGDEEECKALAHLHRDLWLPAPDPSVFPDGGMTDAQDRAEARGQG
jgi:DNA-binding GntR family transcriptional regulator